MFSPANRWSRRQKHARDARFGTQKKYGVDAQLEDGVSYPMFARAAIFFSIWIAEFVFSERDVNAAIFYMIYKSSALVTFLEA